LSGGRFVCRSTLLVLGEAPAHLGQAIFRDVNALFFEESSHVVTPTTKKYGLGNVGGRVVYVVQDCRYLIGQTDAELSGHTRKRT
jgi:hypothetical protein